MKRATILTAIILVASWGCHAQKITQGAINFLKAGDQLHVVFNYDDLKIQGSPEKVFLEERGEEWAGQWEKAKNDSYSKLFLEFLDKNVNAKKPLLTCGDYPNAPYQATVRVLVVGRGWDIICEVVFTKMGDPTPLAKMSLKASHLVPYNIGAPSYLTGKSFSYAGQYMGKVLAPRIK